MRVFKLVSVLTMILALTAVAAVTSASAAMEFLPGAAKTAFTGKSGKATLTAGKLAITCAKSEILAGGGELTSKTEALFVTDFTGCESAGLAVNSLGDAAKTILAHIEAKLCILTESPLVVAILLKPLPLHLEVPSVKLLIIVEGDVLGLLSPTEKETKVATLALNVKEGKQEHTECKDKAGEASKKETLTSKDDAEVAVSATQEVKEGTLTFTTVSQTLMT